MLIHISHLVVGGDIPSKQLIMSVPVVADAGQQAVIDTLTRLGMSPSGWDDAIGRRLVADIVPSQDDPATKPFTLEELHDLLIHQVA
jgi:hypothetical protein